MTAAWCLLTDNPARALAGSLWLVALSGCAAPEAANEKELPETAPATSSNAVDRDGRWQGWWNTPELRDRALAELEHLPRFELGREASPEEIAGLDIDVMPDGTGLPDGEGTVARGRELYRVQCVQCHGEDGRGADYEALVGREPRGGFPFAESIEHVIAVGNYWPYATTLFDYVRRAMPQAAPGTLPPDDVYSLVAFVLHLNEIVPENAVMNRQTLPEVEMPARDRFVYDDRRGGAELR